jgi:hypothetical protein
MLIVHPMFKRMRAAVRRHPKFVADPSDIEIFSRHIMEDNWNRNIGSAEHGRRSTAPNGP